MSQIAILTLGAFNRPSQHSGQEKASFLVVDGMEIKRAVVSRRLARK
jgi:hypothetical protein